MHLISCPDSCSLRKKLDPAARNTNVNRAAAATVSSQGETGVLGGPPVPRGGVPRASAFLGFCPLRVRSSFEVRGNQEVQEGWDAGP